MRDQPDRLVLHIDKSQVVDPVESIQHVERTDASDDVDLFHRSHIFLIVMAIVLNLGYGFGFMVGAISIVGLLLPFLFVALIVLFIFGRIG